jgi:hypothetical protein
MAFVQIIEFRTADIDAVHKIDDEWFEATEGKRTVRRAIVTRDRNDPERYFTLAFFDSYESAMENSSLAETDAAAAQIRAVTQDLAFQDLDVIEDRS